jgi:hypothetical protein
VPIAIFHRIRSPVALATLGAFFVPEPFGICCVIAAAIWWFCRKLHGEWSRLATAGCPSEQCSHKTNFTRTELTDIPFTRLLRLRSGPGWRKRRSGITIANLSPI